MRLFILLGFILGLVASQGSFAHNRVSDVAAPLKVSGDADKSQGTGACILSVQNLFKRLTPADSGEMQVIPFSEAIKDPSCPKKRDFVEIKKAYRMHEMKMHMAAGLGFWKAWDYCSYHYGTFGSFPNAEAYKKCMDERRYTDGPYTN